MSITVACPSCGRKLHAPDSLAGRKAKCPQCGKVVTVTASNEPAASSQSQSQVSGSKRPAPHADEAFVPASSQSQSAKPRSPVEDAEDSYDEKIRESHSDMDDESFAIPPAKSRVAFGLGLPALILGIIAFLFGLVPLLALVSKPLGGLSFLGIFGILGISLGGLALLLGIAGLVVALVQRGNGLGFAIAGLSVSLVAVVVAVFGFLGPPVAKTASDLGTVLNKEPNGEAPVEGKAVPAQEKDVVWFDARKPIRDGDVQVSLGWIIISNVKIKDVLGDQTVTDKKHLGIQVFIENVGKTRKIEHRGWSGAFTMANPLDLLKGDSGSRMEALSSATGRYAASLSDNFANSYKRLSLEAGAQIANQVSSPTSIRPGEKLQDMLVFEQPLDNIQFLRLELPASAYGGSGTLRFQIPAKMIQR
jgi:hypothetical protein